MQAPTDDVSRFEASVLRSVEESAAKKNKKMLEITAAAQKMMAT